MFQNTSDKTLKLTMTLDLYNLRIRHEPQDNYQTELIIRPGSFACIILNPTDLSGESHRENRKIWLGAV